MKLLMLCREPRLYSCQRLVEAAEDNGHQLDIIDPNRCFLSLESNANSSKFHLYYQVNDNSPVERLTDYDAIIPRFGTTSTEMGCCVLRHFIANNIPCINHAEAILNARNKWQSLYLLHLHGLPIPKTLFNGSESIIKNSLPHFDQSIVIKTQQGAQGIGVMLAEKPQHALSIAETLQQSGIKFLLQDFIQEAENSDLRCFVIDGKVIASMQRCGQNGEFRANAHRGASAHAALLTEQERTLAIQATQVLGLDIAGVDIIRSHQGPLILEVNASPGLEMIEKVTKINIAQQIINYTEKRVMQHQYPNKQVEKQ